MIPNIHTYTTNASLSSIITIDQLMLNKSPVLCITNPTMIDTIEFYISCKNNNKKPIIGLDINLAWGDVELLRQRYNRIASRLTLIAKNEIGYKNLIRLSTFGHLYGFYEIPRIDFKTLEKYSAGLICLINSIDSSVALHFNNGNNKEAMNDFVKLSSIFKSGDLYGEIFLHDLNKNLNHYGIPHIVTSEAKYLNSNDYALWMYYLAINENVSLDVVIKRRYSNLFYYPTIEDWFGYEHELNNLWELIDKIEEYNINKFDIQLPKMGVSNDEFINILYNKLKIKNLNKQEYIDRLNYEVQTIITFGYVDYFMMVYDMINYCNTNLSGYISAGRGSVGGCLIAYLLGITRVDPIHPYNLDVEIPFDRFLNSGRQTLPDIDLDFNPKDRQSIIEYLGNKYGKDMCSNILTVTTMGARMAMRSVCRISGKLNQDMDNIIKSFPTEQNLTLDLIKESDIYKKNVENKLFVDMFNIAYKLEGLSKSYGVHACFSYESQLLTNSGYKQIGNIVNQKIDILTNTGLEVADIVYAGYKNIYRLRCGLNKNTRRYIELFVTEDQKIATNKGWVEAKDCIDLNPIIIDCWNKFNHKDILAGWIWNNGYYNKISKCQTIYFTPKDDDAKIYLSRFCTGRRDLDRPDRMFVKSEYVHYIEDNFGDGFKSKLKIKGLPKFSDIYSKLGWLCGFISSNGSIQRGCIRVNLACESLAQFIKDELMSLGIKSSKLSIKSNKKQLYTQKCKVNFTESYQFELSSIQSYKFYSIIGLIQRYKKNKIRQYKFLYFDKIGSQDTYDFMVRGTNHSGYVNGLLVHNSGIAISSNNIQDTVPLCKFGDKLSTQYTQEYLEYLGIAKFDILGLNTLQIILDTVKFIIPDKKIPEYIEWLDAIPVDDSEVYYFLNQLHIEGIFQWDTHNYRSCIKEIKPHNFKELVDLNALGRSASLLSGLTDRYIRRKNGIEPIEPLHPLLTNIMAYTLDLPLYQEQIMQIFVALADYTQSEADDVRKAIGKKIPELMEKQKSLFYERCITKGIEINQAKEIWEIIDKFSKYTWNLGHAVAYTRICYETLYLACHYPIEFYAACINNSDDSTTLSVYINALKRRGIKIENVDINNSKYEYTVKNGKIIAGFIGVKHISENTVKKLINLRGDGFDSWMDFEKRVSKKIINKTTIKSLYVAGAFDDKRFNKDELLSSIGINDNFDLILDQYSICGRVIYNLNNIIDGYSEIKDLNLLKCINVLAYVIRKKEIYTKKGDKMAFLSIEDFSGIYEVTVFPNVWKINNNIVVGKLYSICLSYEHGLIVNQIQGISKEKLIKKRIN